MPGYEGGVVVRGGDPKIELKAERTLSLESLKRFWKPKAIVLCNFCASGIKGVGGVEECRVLFPIQGFYSVWKYHRV